MFKLLSSLSKWVDNIILRFFPKQIFYTYFRLQLSKKNLASELLGTIKKRDFHYTPVLYAEPLKKKKKMDPAILKAREERRRKKLEKQIRRLEKNARQLKPIDELEVPLNLFDEREWVLLNVPSQESCCFNFMSF